MIGFPLLLIPFSIYFMIAFLTPDVSWTSPVYAVPIPLKSGVAFTATVGDVFLAFALLLLMFEFIKSTRHGKSFVEHFLSLLLAGGAAALFWMVREAGNSTFLLFTLICFVDLFAGFAASLRRARRAIPEVAPLEPPPPRAVPVRAESERVEPARVEPARVEPTRDPFAPPPPAMPRAEPVVRIEPVQKSET